MAAGLRRARSGGAVYCVVPVYVTSFCLESCRYCAFRAGNPALEGRRRRLTDADLETEVRVLVGTKGYRAIELVYAEDPWVRPDAMCRHIELVRRVLAREGGGVVGLNAESLETAEYRALAEAGLDFALLWQETYDRDRYRALHPTRAKKSRFEDRLDAWERMLAGGIRHIGLGVLSGLADWRFDWAMLLRHEAYLAETYGVTPAVLGLPRLKPAPGVEPLAGARPPSDAELLGAVAVHTLFAPDTRPFVSTREPWDLMVRLAEGGHCLFTLDCSTTPGGYTGAAGGPQFATHTFPAETYAVRLRAAGLTPLFRWGFGAPLSARPDGRHAPRAAAGGTMSG
jgi:2-iminoacetate synthase